MQEFLATSLAFPTVVYSIALMVAVGLWLVASIGLFDIEGLDLDLGDGGGADSAVGMFSRLGLDGVPWLLVATLLVFFGWTITYFVHLFLLAALPAPLRWLVGAGVALAALVPSILLTAAVLRPLRRWLLRLRPAQAPSLLGRVAVVRTPTVDAAQGMADLDDGGAGLILQVRVAGDAPLQRGDRVVLVEHATGDNTWRVVRETDYAPL